MGRRESDSERKLLTFSKSLWKPHIYVPNPSVTWTKELLIVAWEFGSQHTALGIYLENLGQAARFSKISYVVNKNLLVEHRTYDAGILSNRMRQGPVGGPSPRHWTFEGSYETTRTASPLPSPREPRPSQLKYTGDCKACVRARMLNLLHELL